MNLDGKITNPGELRTTIIIKSRVITTDQGNFQQKDASTFATVKAKWVNSHGNESLSSDILQSQMIANVTIRYIEGLNVTFLIEKDGVLYQIIPPLDDIRDRHEYINFNVKLVQAG